MKTRLTPAEKKDLSYQHDRRDNYGENSKSSRKNVRLRKRWVNQTFRQRIRQALHGADARTETGADELTNRIREVQRPDWAKSPHEPLGLRLLRKKRIPSERIRSLLFRTRRPATDLLNDRREPRTID